MVNVVPFGRVVSEVDIRADQLWPELELLSVSQKRGVVPRSEVSDKEARAEDLSKYKRCWVNDIVLNRMSAYQGALGIARQEGIVSPDYAVLRPRAKMDAKFLTYLLKSEWFVGQMTSRLRGIGSPGTGSVRTPRVNIQDLRDIDLPAPPVEEQRRIADFLDDQVARVDEIASLNKSLLHIQRERFRADVTLTMSVDSKLRIRNVAWVNPVTPIPEHLNEQSDVLFLPLEAVWTTRNPTLEQQRHLKDVASGYVRFRQGDVLVPKVTPTFQAGRSMVIDTCVQGFGAASTEVHVVRPRSTETDSRFLMYRFLAKDFLNEGVSRFQGVAGLQRVPTDFLLGTTIPEVGLVEQRAVVSRLDTSLHELVATTDSIERSLALLEERKRALITAAVTGELDVTTAKPIGMGKWVPNVGAGLDVPAAAQASSIGGIG